MVHVVSVRIDSISSSSAYICKLQSVRCQQRWGEVFLLCTLRGAVQSPLTNPCLGARIVPSGSFLPPCETFTHYFCPASRSLAWLGLWALSVGHSTPQWAVRRRGCAAGGGARAGAPARSSRSTTRPATKVGRRQRQQAAPGGRLAGSAAPGLFCFFSLALPPVLL